MNVGEVVMEAKQQVCASLPSKYLPDGQLKKLLQFVKTQADVEYKY